MRSDRRSFRAADVAACAIAEAAMSVASRTALGGWPVWPGMEAWGETNSREHFRSGARGPGGLGENGDPQTRNGGGREAVVRKIERDANRFKQIVRGKIKSDLRKYITHGEMIGKTGGEFVSIPLPQIEIPEFRYGTKNRGGVGQGPGDVGTPIGRSGDGEAGQGAGEAPGPPHPRGRADPGRARPDPRRGARPAPDRAQGPGQHHRGEGQVHRHPPGRAREPPPLQADLQEGPQAADRLEHVRPARPAGHPDPRGQALPLVEPDRAAPVQRRRPLPDGRLGLDDRRPEGDRPDRGVLDRHLAQEPVRRRDDPLHHPRRRGPRGRRAHLLSHPRERRHADQLGLQPGQQDHRRADHPPIDWNIYVLHFSDGDNWGEDNRHCISLLRDQLLPKCNLFGYGQVESPYGSGEFYRELEEAFDEVPNLALSEIRNKEGIYDSIKEFLGRGR